MRERLRDARSMLQLSRQIYSECVHCLFTGSWNTILTVISAIHKQNNQQLVRLQLLLPQVHSQMRYEDSAKIPLMFTSSPTISPHSKPSEDPDEPDTELLSPSAISYQLVRRRAISRHGSVWNIQIQGPRWLRFTTWGLEIQSNPSPWSFNSG